ncbi:MAG TPA: hypothetical protein VJH70_01345 [Candidatus Paceibacterota bacterium]
MIPDKFSKERKQVVKKSIVEKQGQSVHQQKRTNLPPLSEEEKEYASEFGIR